MTGQIKCAAPNVAHGCPGLVSNLWRPYDGGLSFGNILGLCGGVGGGGSGLGVLARPVFLGTFTKIIVALKSSDYRFILPRHVPALDKL